MPKRPRQPAQVSAEDLVSISAKRAAAEAVQHHNHELRQAEGSIGAFAIYAWAFFAFAASGIGGSTLYLSNESKPQYSQQQAITLPATQVENVDRMTTAAISTTSKISVPAEKSDLGVTIGGFTDVNVIMDIYQLVQNNEQLNLTEKEPLVQFKLQNDIYRAALVVGPFDNFQKIVDFCSNAELPCETSSYTGDPLFAD